MIRLGLTGSIGMGKSTTAALFAEAGAAVYDADAAVHALYRAGGEAGSALAPLFPGVVGPDGAVDRDALSRRIKADAEALPALEAAVHPLLATGRAAFLQASEAAGIGVAVFDIPLLFETDAADGFDAVVVASAPADVQRARVLARPGMEADKLERLLERQTPDADKRARADFVVETGRGLDDARAQVRAIMAAVLRPQAKPT